MLTQILSGKIYLLIASFPLSGRKNELYICEAIAIARRTVLRQL
ncbi:hypothetical protein [Fischerella sp. PCC 9605]|nr:hypothetical protein [Fischerella sp. PCC 9605]